jgi:ATP-binding protein involved in chromosome partitioning
MQTEILRFLDKIADPNADLSLVETGRIMEVLFDEKGAQVSLNTYGLEDAVKSNLNMALQNEFLKAFPDIPLHLHLLSIQSDFANRPLSKVKNIIAVASGKGGVGKSTVSTNISLALKNMGYKVGLLDADLYGPSIPKMMGVSEQKPRVKNKYGKAFLVPIEKEGVHLMSIGFVVDPDQAVVLRGPRLGGIIKQFLNDTLWPELDFLIVDLPPGTGDIQLSLVQTVPVSAAIMVTTPQEVALIDAIKAMNMFLLDHIAVPIIGVVENMSWFTPAELPDNKYYIFGEGGGKTLAKLSNSVLLGQLPLIQAVREKGDLGSPPAKDPDGEAYAYFKKIAENVVRQMIIRNETLEPTKIVEMKN